MGSVNVSAARTGEAATLRKVTLKGINAIRKRKDKQQRHRPLSGIHSRISTAALECRSRNRTFIGDTFNCDRVVLLPGKKEHL